MKNTPTERGFSRYEFTDFNGEPCSLQQSSIATEDCIWLGCNEIGLKQFEPGLGWSDINLPDEGIYGKSYVANNRMHLSRKEVEQLLPLLEKFVNEGEI